MSVLIEVVACTAEDAVRAEEAGAHRIELVSAISEGGLTPSLGTLQEVKSRCRIPIVAMLRPRGGDFAYRESEFATMRRDALSLRESGADGLVTGMLTPTGETDDVRLRLLLSENVGIPWIFHRAFDAALEPFGTLEAIIGLGFVRLLTSGAAPNARAGSAMLRDLGTKAAGRIEIMPGGGIRGNNAMTIVRESGATSIHIGPFVLQRDDRTGAEHLALDAAAVGYVVRAAEGSADRR